MVTKFHAFPWNPNVRHCLHNIPHVSETDESTHTMLLYCFNIYLNVILPSTPTFPKWSPSFVFLLKLSVNFTSISLPRTSHICNFKDQTFEKLAGQEIMHLIWNLNTHFFVQWSYTEPNEHRSRLHKFKIYFNIILHIQLHHTNIIFSTGFPTKTSLAFTLMSQRFLGRFIFSKQTYYELSQKSCA